MKTMTHASVFSGIGGFELAAEWMGWENLFYCELGKFGRDVCGYYWKNAVSYEDIKKTDFTFWRGRVDVLSGGPPCQPYSVAGQRLGTDDARHLWPEMCRAVKQIAPRFVVVENVVGLINWNGGMVFDEVQTDLEAQGYEVAAFVLPAAGKNAPHKRERVWIIAHNKHAKRSAGGFQARGSEPIHGAGNKRAFTNAKGPRSRELSNQKGEKGAPHRDELFGERGRFSIFTDTTSGGIGQGDGNGKPRQSDKGRPRNNWENWPTQSPIRGRDDGVPTRLDGITLPRWKNETIKAFGNAIVPQVAWEIFKAINQINNN